MTFAGRRGLRRVRPMPDQGDSCGAPRAWPRSTASTSSVATSLTASPPPVACIPSSSMTVQNGQATARVRRSRRRGLARALLVDLAGALLQPHVRAAGAAAEGPLLAARHLERAADGRDDLAGLRADVVVAGQVAGVVVGDRARCRRRAGGGPRGPAPPAAACGGPPRSGPPKSAYSLASVLKQCGQVVTIFVTPLSPRVSTFCFASAWNVYSSPMRRAGSPVQHSRAPRIAKSTPASLSSFAVEIAPTRARSSNAGAQPTQNRTAGGGIARLQDPDVQALGPVRRARRRRRPTGCWCRSRSRSIAAPAAGNRGSRP